MQFRFNVLFQSIFIVTWNILGDYVFKKIYIVQEIVRGSVCFQ